MSNRKFLTALLLLSLLSVVSALCGAEKKLPDANSFFKGLESVETLSCDFVQEQFISGLKRPIRLSGSYYMTKHGNLAWIVKKPISFYCVIYNGKLSSWDAESNDKKVISLKDHPAFSTMINMMKDFFAGRISVEKDYQCTVVSAEKIILVPLTHTPLAGNVKKIDITLAADKRSISEVRILAGNGDRNVMYFKNSVLDMPIPASVWTDGVAR